MGAKAYFSQPQSDSQRPPKRSSPISAFTFPRWSNRIRDLIGVGVGLGAIYASVIVNYGFSPIATDVGYQPIQPVPFSHAIHAGKLGLDCRYCHTTVEQASHAAVPPTQTCMGCHTNIVVQANDKNQTQKGHSDRLDPLYTSFQTGMPVQWVKVHDLPDYVYFNHSAHVNRGVGCVECHGRIDTMEVVYQHERLSMGWCLECHRNPEPRLRDPIKDRITQMDWSPPKDRAAYGAEVRAKYNINPSQDCSTCHH